MEIFSNSDILLQKCIVVVAFGNYALGPRRHRVCHATSVLAPSIGVLRF